MSRAVVYDRLGGPEVLHLAEVDVPAPGAGEVLLEVRAAGLNPFDAKVRAGFIPMDAPFPRRIGSDVAGTVVAVGADAVYWDGTPIAVGDEVAGRANGSLAEQVVARAAELARRPAKVPAEVAGGLWVAGLTAVSILATAPVDSSDTVLVGGAAGGVGIVTVQLAVAAGARVVATASERNHALLRSLGAHPVGYGPGLAERVGAITAVYDCHGREALLAGVAAGVPAHRMVEIADHAAPAELGVLPAEREARTARSLAGLLEELAAGRLVLPVAAMFPLEQAAKAFAALDAPHAPGKLVLVR